MKKIVTALIMAILAVTHASAQQAPPTKEELLKLFSATSALLNTDRIRFREFVLEHAKPIVGPGIGFAQETGNGFLVQSIYDGGPADKAGIRPGDFLIAVNGIGFNEGFARWVQELKNWKMGDTVTMTIRRDREPIVIPITIEIVREDRSAEATQWLRAHEAEADIMIARIQTIISSLARTIKDSGDDYLEVFQNSFDRTLFLQLRQEYNRWNKKKHEEIGKILAPKLK